MYLKFLALAIGLFLIVDVVFYAGIKPLLTRLNNKSRWVFNSCYWGFTLFSIILLSVAVYFYYIQVPPPKFARVYLTGFTLIVLLSKLVGILFFLFNWLIQLTKLIFNKVLSKKDNYNPSRKEFIRKTGVIASVLPFLSLSYGMIFGAFNYRIRREKIFLPNLPAEFEALKIVQLSDIHSGSFISKDPLEEAVKLVMNEGADLVLFTGDLVNEIAEEAEVFIDVFKKINAPMGVFGILGNHDYGDYFYEEGDVAGRIHNRNKMKEIYDAIGWKLLLNEHFVFESKGKRLGLIGSENWGSEARFQKYGDLSIARANMPDCPVNILMTHDPSHWEAKVLENHPDIDLTLSGHTHGFQMGVETKNYKWSPAKYLYKQWAGLYTKGINKIYVNRGLGFIGYPGRLGIQPEITVLELTAKQA